MGYGRNLVCLALLAVMFCGQLVWTAPARGQQASSSLQVGEWAKYILNWTFNSNMPGSNSSILADILDIDWFQGNVDAVSGNTVTVGLTTHFENGTETLDTLQGDITTGDGNLSSLPAALLIAPLVVESNLSVGDSIPGLFYNVTDTVSQVYAGYRRDINCADFAYSTAGVSLGTYYYYDKSTGLLTEVETEYSISEMGYQMSYSASITVNATNMFTDQIHNVTIENVSLTPATVYVGDLVNVTALVKNEGNEVETFDIAAYYNTTGTEQANPTEIGQQQIANLANGSSENVQFVWNTTGLAADNYTLQVVSTLQGVVNMANNTFTLGPLTVQKTQPLIQPFVLYAIIGMAAVAIVVTAFYLRKNRRENSKTETQPTNPTVQDQQPVP